MGLERVFASGWTLRNLRSRPLGHLLDGFSDWLLDRGFRRRLVRVHVTNISHLNGWLAEKAWRWSGYLSRQEVEAFFEAYRFRCRNQGRQENHLRRVGHSINRFCQYLGGAGLFDPLEKPTVYQPLMQAYLSWMGDRQHAAPRTLENRREGLKPFLEWLGPQATAEGVSQLNAERIENFFMESVQEMGPATRRLMQTALRTFLRFCSHEGYIQAPLAQAVPTLRTYKLSTVPRGLSEAQAQAVLEGVDRRTDVGRRDYAILQLLHTYGVRGGQVRALRLKDILWAEDQILFRACKQGKDSLLPLTEEVGKSLLDYLRYARPHYAFPEVFLTCRAPYHPLLNVKSLTAIVERRIKAAGIDIPSKDSHVFRHGFATRMVAEGHSLKAIADVLGHRDLSTTFIYAKVDFHTLKEVALDWPEEVMP